MRPTVKASSTGDGMGDLKLRLAALRRTQVYVGVPEDTSARPEGADGKPQMNNAALVYLHTNGSQISGLAARPIIEPAISEPDNRDPIARELRNAARSTLDERPDEATRDLNLAGTLAANAAIRWFTDPRNGWPADSDATIARKIAKGGSAANDPVTLVDSAEMRASIKYLVEENK